MIQLTFCTHLFKILYLLMVPSLKRKQLFRRIRGKEQEHRTAETKGLNHGNVYMKMVILALGEGIIQGTSSSRGGRLERSPKDATEVIGSARAAQSRQMLFP